MVNEGYLHEWVCMGQCNLFIQAAKDSEVLANRWHIAFYSLAVDKGYVMPLPTMDAAGLLRTATMGG